MTFFWNRKKKDSMAASSPDGVNRSTSEEPSDRSTGAAE
jgi:hypothetical protein